LVPEASCQYLTNLPTIRNSQGCHYSFNKGEEKQQTYSQMDTLAIKLFKVGPFYTLLWYEWLKYNQYNFLTEENIWWLYL